MYMCHEQRAVQCYAFFMRTAYLLLGVLWLIVIVGAAYGFNRGFTPSRDTGSMSNQEAPTMATSTLSLTSTAFENGGLIPAKYTCDEDRTLSPQLSIAGVPAEAKSLTLIMDDPDVPKVIHPDGMFDHWVLFNIPPTTTGIPEGGSAGIAGRNGAGKNAYTGPCPPPQYEPSEHRYFFKLYALDTELALQAGASKAEVEKAMQGHVVGEVQLLGRYKRK